MAKIVDFCMQKKYVGAIRYIMGFVGRKNLLVHRDPWRMDGIGKQDVFWETTQDQLRTLGEGLRFSKMVPYGSFLLELGIDSYDIYTTYKNHGDWQKELFEDIGAWLGGDFGAFVFFMLAPEAGLGAAVLVGGLFCFGASEFFSWGFEEIYDQSEQIF